MSQKIAITVEAGGELSASMDPRFGRAPAFLIVDGASGEILGSEPNDTADAAHGAGTGAAAAMARLGVTGVISGRFGPKAYQALKALKIAMWLAPPGLSAGQALEKYQAGELTAAIVKEFR
jgi:predicted Fe-Mo cluster-binding NifX family protein